MSIVDEKIPAWLTVILLRCVDKIIVNGRFDWQVRAIDFKDVLILI
jgi:hypothetical protein